MSESIKQRAELIEKKSARHMLSINESVTYDAWCDNANVFKLTKASYLQQLQRRINNPVNPLN